MVYFASNQYINFNCYHQNHSNSSSTIIFLSLLFIFIIDDYILIIKTLSLFRNIQKKLLAGVDGRRAGAECGLKVGDIIISVQGQLVDSPERTSECFSSLSKRNEVRVCVCVCVCVDM